MELLFPLIWTKYSINAAKNYISFFGNHSSVLIYIKLPVNYSFGTFLFMLFLGNASDIHISLVAVWNKEKDFPSVGIVLGADCNIF